MLAAARRMIGSIDVKEANGRITISGIPANTVTRDIQRHWATGRVNAWMFTRFNYNEIVIPSFFAVELFHILTVLLGASRVRTNRRALTRILNELKTETWLRQIDEDHDDVLNFKQLDQIKFKMLPHQQAFLERYNWVKPRYNLRGLLLMVPPGGGKTISDIAIAVCCEADVVYVVSPKNAVYDVWRKTLTNDMTRPQSMWIAADGKPFDGDAKWRIFHYETLDQAVAMAKKHPEKKAAIILDESHNFNDHESLRTETFLELCQITQSEDIVWASGTPIKAMGKEAIPLIRSIDPLFTADVEMRFRKIFGQNAERGYDILNHRLGLISYKVPKSEFMDKDPIIQDIKVTMPNAEHYTLRNLKTVMQAFIAERRKYYAERKEDDHRFYHNCIKMHYGPKPRSPEENQEFVAYQQYVSTFVKYGFDARSMGEQAKFCNIFERDCIIPKLPKELRAQFIDVKSIVKYVDLKIRGECLGRILSKEREQCHVDMVKHFDFDKLIDNAKKKTLIFTSFVNVVDAVFDVLTKGGYAPVRVYGDTNSQLVDILDRFTNQPDVNPAIATYQSLSTAVPILAANNVLFVNSPFRHHEQEQAISRCSRLGQDEQVYGWRLFLDTGEEPNISTRSEEILNWSKQEVSAMLGVDTNTVDNIALEDIFGGEPDIDPEDVSVCLEAHDLVTEFPATAYW